MKEFIEKKVLSHLPIDKTLSKAKKTLKRNVNIDIGRNKRMRVDTTDGFVYEYSDNGERKGPFCPVCWHNENEAIELAKTATPNVYYCGKCDRYRHPSNYQEPVDEDLRNWFYHEG